MVKTCFACDEITQNDAAVYCEFCGTKFPETEMVLLHQIHEQVQELQVSAERLNLTIFLLILGTITLAIIALIIGERNFILQALARDPSYLNQPEGYLVAVMVCFIIFLFILAITVIRNAKTRS